MLNVLPLTFAEIRIKGKAADQPLMEKRLFAFREDTHWKMMTLCALYRDAAAFIDALGTIHFWELRVRRFYHCHYTEVLWQGWEPCSIFGVASPKRSWRTAELSWRLGGEKKLWDCFYLAESENLRALGTEGTQREMNLAWELGTGVCRSNHHWDCIKNFNSVAHLLLVPVQSNALFLFEIPYVCQFSKFKLKTPCMAYI